MTTPHFLITYSISPIEGSDNAAKIADKVRKGIANIESPDWVKLSTVETTFSGRVTLTAETVCSGQLIPDTVLSFSSVFAGANPSLN